MNAVFRPLTDTFLFVQVAAIAVCLLLIVVVGSYFFARAVLNVMGLHSASSGQIFAEVKLLKISLAILVLTIVCATIAGFLGGLGGITY